MYSDTRCCELIPQHFGNWRCECACHLVDGMEILEIFCKELVLFASLVIRLSCACF